MQIYQRDLCDLCADALKEKLRKAGQDVHIIVLVCLSVLHVVFTAIRWPAKEGSMATAENGRQTTGNKVRIVLIGKTGAGKSSLGNTIAGVKKFQPVVGMGSGTQKTDWAEVIRDGRTIQVTDTPGVCDTRRKPVEVYKEIAKCMTTAAPGPHAILMVLRASERFTEEEGKAYDELKHLFTGFANYLIIVFTRMDELEECDLDLESQLREAPPKVGKIIKEADGRYIGIKNKTGWEERKIEGDKIMGIVYTMMGQNKEKYFSNRIFKAVAEKVEEEAFSRHVTTELIKKETVEETNPSFIEKIGLILKDIFITFVSACNIL